MNDSRLDKQRGQDDDWEDENENAMTLRQFLGLLMN